MRAAFIIGSILFSLLGKAQSVEQFLAWANEAKRLGDHRATAEFYEEVLDREPGIMVHQWELAEAYRNSDQCDKAAKVYQRIAGKDLRKTYPNARMYQAEMEQCDLRPGDAKVTWEKVLKKEKKQFGFRALKAKNALLSIAMMDSLRENKVDVHIEQLGAPVNSCYSEMSPRIHDSSLYFTTTNAASLGLHMKEGEAYSVMGIAKSAKSKDGWDIPTPVLVDPEQYLGNTTFTSEGHMLFSKKTTDGTKIFISRNNGGNMGSAEGIKMINRKGNNTKPMVAMFKGVQTLFFASDRRGGSGGWDIWMVSLEDGKANSLQTAGAPVNSPGDETCPFYDAENEKLYFASNYHPGMGGYDLFSSFSLNESFSRPVNWGYPLNSERDELYPAFYPDMKLGFFSRIPFENACCADNNCCPDVFQFQYDRDTIPVDPVVTELLSGSSEEVQSKLRGLLPIRLYFHNDEPNPRTTQTTTLFTYKQTYLKYRELIPRYHKEQGGDDARVSAISTFFEQEAEGNFNKLNKYLDLLQVILEKGDTVEITIRGFASPLAESDYNVNLSLRRISSLQNYLRSYNNGALRPYLNGNAPQGQLIVSKAPYGESTSKTTVSDEVSDLKNSVYSRGAALERRIEVEAIDLFSAKTITDTLRITQNVGKVLQNLPRDIEFMVENSKDAPLEFIESKADCGCTTATLPESSILPGERSPVTVRFSGKAQEGPFERKVYLITNGEPRVIELKIEGIILPIQ